MYNIRRKRDVKIKMKTNLYIRTCIKEINLLKLYWAVGVKRIWIMQFNISS